MRVFVSYAREDRERVRPIYNLLKTRGFDVWWDEQLTPGDNFHNEISNEVDRCACLVVCWTSISANSEYVRGEANRAQGLRKLLPLYLDKLSGQLPPQFGGLQGVELWHGQELDDPATTETICASVKAVAEHANPTVDFANIDLTLGSPANWYDQEDMLTSSSKLTASLAHGRAVIDWALSHGPNHPALRNVGLSLAELNICMKRRSIDHSEHFFEDFLSFVRACCSESPFAVFEKNDGEAVVAHRFRHLQGPIFSNRMGDLPVHSAEFYASVLRKNKPRILWTNAADLQDVYSALIALKLDLTPLPVEAVIDQLCHRFGDRFRRGVLVNIQYTLRNADVLEFRRQGPGPQNGLLSLDNGATTISAMKALKKLASDKIDHELGAVSSRELARLFEETPSLELRPAA